MDDARFDALTRALAAPRPRRALVRFFGGLALAGPLALLGVAEAAAKRKRKRKKKRKPRTPSGSAPPPAPPAPPPAQGVSVTIRGFAFDPPTVAVAAGSTVTWTNRDRAAHTATADDGSFESGRLSQGQSFTETFATADTYAYHCSIHPDMRATVVVT